MIQSKLIKVHMFSLLIDSIKHKIVNPVNVPSSSTKLSELRKMVTPRFSDAYYFYSTTKSSDEIKVGEILLETTVKDKYNNFANVDKNYFSVVFFIYDTKHQPSSIKFYF